MPHESGAGKRWAQSWSPHGMERAVVTLMERFPIDRSTVRLAPIEKEPKLPGPRRPPVGAPFGHNGAAPPRTKSPASPVRGGECLDLYVLDNRKMESKPAGRPQSSTSTSSYRLDLKEKIKSETMRHVRWMIAQRISLRRAEAKLSRWTTGGHDEISRPQHQGNQQGKRGEERHADIALAPLFPRQGEGPTVVVDKSEGSEQTKGAPLLDVHGIRGIRSRFPPVVGDASRVIDEQRQFLREGLLRSVLERPNKTSGVLKKGLGHFSVLRGNCLRFQEDSRCDGERNLRPYVPAFASFWRPLFSRMTNSPSEVLKTEDISCFSVRRLVGIPNHDRGLYASLRSGWQKAAKTKTFARMLLKGRVQPSSWWMLAESREGMITAAQELGLDPEVYQGLMTSWIWNGMAVDGEPGSTAHPHSPISGFVQSIANSLFPRAEDAVRADGTLAHALGNASAVPPLVAGDEELARMHELARKLGHLRMSGVISSEELGRLLEGDKENAEQEINRLLGSEAVRQWTTLHQANTNTMYGTEGSDGLFQELARALLQERRRAAMSAGLSGVKEGVLGSPKSLGGPEGCVSSMMQSGESQKPGGQILPPIKSGRHHTPLVGSEEEAVNGALWGHEGQHAAMREEERQAAREAAAAAAAATAAESADEVKDDGLGFYLPGLRGSDEGQALPYGPKRRPHRGPDPTSPSRGDSTSFFPDLNCSSSFDPLKATQAPSKGAAILDELKSLEAADSCGGTYDGPDWWKRRRMRPPPGLKGDWTPGDYEEGEAEEENENENRYEGENDEMNEYRNKFKPGRKFWNKTSEKQKTDEGWIGEAEEEEERTRKNEGEGEGSGQRENRTKSDNSLLLPRHRRRQPLDRPENTTPKRSSFFEKKLSFQDTQQLLSSDSDEAQDDAAVRERPRKSVNLFNDGKLRKRAEVIVDGVEGGRAKRKVHPIPPFVRKPKSVLTSSTVRDTSSVQDPCDVDSNELSSLFADDETDLVLFLATFPAEELHVRLRNEAKGVLGGLEDESSALIKYATNTRHRLQGVFGTTAPHGAAPSAKITSKEEEETLKMKLNVDDLRHRFEVEARERYAELWQTLQELRQKVLEQETLIQQCRMDVTNLSQPAPGEDRDAFALRLTQEVNKYAKLHHLDPKQLCETKYMKDDYDAAVQAFLNSFAVTRGKRPGHDVGCQCNPDDIGYVDEDIKRIEEEMEDLYFHARGLLNAIKLAIISVGNVMGFHAALELESTCKYCFCIFENPRTLWPCGHTFCQRCLAYMFADNGELICDECGSLCEVGYTPNLALELVASYQVMQNHDNYERDEDEEEFCCNAQRRTIDGVLAALLRDLMNTQSSITDTRRLSRGRMPSFRVPTDEVDRAESAM